MPFERRQPTSSTVAGDQQIDAMEQKSITDQNAANYRSHFQWFVVIALALLMADILIAERNQSDRKSRKITVA